MHSFYLDAIRNFEGFTPKATWDYAQHSNGYGTRARYPGEVIDGVEAERRFREEISGARAIVEKAAPHVDEGTKAALTSLTYNAGTAWIGSGLGEAVRRGDLDAARDIFQKYTKAGGEVLPGLVNRRAQEALWIGNPDAVAAGAGSGGTTTALASASASSSASPPPVVADRDQGARQLAEMISGRGAMPARGSVGPVAEGGAARAPLTPLAEQSGSLGRVASEALMAMIGAEGLEGAGVADLARLAQLGRGSALARSDRSEQDQEKQTRRV